MDIFTKKMSRNAEISAIISEIEFYFTKQKSDTLFVSSINVELSLTTFWRSPILPP